MRYRRPKYFKEKLESYEGTYFVKQPEQYKGDWRNRVEGCNENF